MKKRLLSLTAVLVLLLSGCAETEQKSPQTEETIPEFTETYPVTVDFLKVGKADAAVIRTENHTVVIDCGEKSDGSKVISCLQNLGTEKIDTLILTHYDQDHIGGAAKVLNQFPAGRVLAPDYQEESKEYEKLCTAMAAQGLETERIQKSVLFTLDDTVFQIYPCQKQNYSDGDDNNHSLVIKMTHHDQVFLFAGDAMQERLTEIMDIGDCDVLKEPYHGREIENLGEFLDHVTPEYAVVSTDEETLSETAMQELTDRHIETYITFSDGNIRFTSDGSKVSVETGLNFKEEIK